MIGVRCCVKYNGQQDYKLETQQCMTSLGFRTFRFVDLRIEWNDGVIMVLTYSFVSLKTTLAADGPTPICVRCRHIYWNVASSNVAMEENPAYQSVDVAAAKP